MPDPWYKNGLRFRCTRCGKCCTGEPGHVWVNEEEIQTIADFLGEPVEETTSINTRKVGKRTSLREKPNHDCVFYDRKEGCTVYPARPRQCRTWPFWEYNLRTPEHWQQTCEVCPGAGKGELISVEEITERIREKRS